jgi:hypothetical protein
MKLGTWILSLVEPIAARIFTSLGLSVVSIVGMQQVFDLLQSRLVANLNGLPSDALQLFLLGGGAEGLGILLGAITTKLMLWQAQKSVQFLGRSPS